MERVVFSSVRNCLSENFIDAGEVSKKEPFRALDFVELNVIGEGSVVLKHFSRDRFWSDVFSPNPRVSFGESVEGAVDELAIGLRIFELL